MEYNIHILSFTACVFIQMQLANDNKMQNIISSVNIVYV